MTRHEVVGAECSSSGELLLRAQQKLFAQARLMCLSKTMAGFLNSAHAIAQGEMCKGLTAKRQRQWGAASARERLRQVGLFRYCAAREKSEIVNITGCALSGL